MQKSALITGGSRGIGYGIAVALAQQGYNLAINGIRSEEQVQDQLNILKITTLRWFIAPGSIGDREDRNRIISKAIDHFRKIDVLVNNAGVAPAVRQDILELDEENYDRLLDTNLKGTFFFTQQVAKQMLLEKQQSTGYHPCIITITSISAEVASVNRENIVYQKPAWR